MIDCLNQTSLMLCEQRRQLQEQRPAPRTKNYLDFNLVNHQKKYKLLKYCIKREKCLPVKNLYLGLERPRKGASGMLRLTGLVLFLLCCTALRSEPIRVYDWVYGEEIFEQHADQFSEAIGYPVEFHGVDFPYSENIEQLLIYGEPMDIVGMFTIAARRLGEAGWIEDLSDDKRFVDAAKHAYAGVAESLQFDDRMYGAGQIATGLAVPLVDMDKYRALGLVRADFPADWSSLHVQLIAAASAGAKGIYLPYWFNDVTGLPLGFTAEVLNRGGAVISPDTGAVAMDPNSGPAYNTLVEWRQLVVSGAVDPKTISMSHRDFVAAFYSGEHTVSSHKTDMLILSKKLREKSKNISLFPRVNQNWGVVGVLMFGLVRQENESPERNEARRKLLLLNTRGAGNLKFSVSKMWLRERGNFSTYRDFMESEQALSILRSKLTYANDAEVLIDVFEHLDVTTMESRVPWHHEFYHYMKEQLQAYLSRPEIPPAEVINNLNAKILELRVLYGY